jgi:hypothetical protein
MDVTCKNCSNVCDTYFCGVCGQKMNTKRFDTKHILVHEIPHSIFHLDKGFLLTTKALIKRPGHFIRDYIEGKRANHYGPIQYLFIIGIVMGVMMGLFNYNAVAVKINDDIQKARPTPQEINTSKTNQEITKEKKRKEKLEAFTKKIPSAIANQYKWFIFIMIPASALAGFWITRKLGYNLAENIVRALYTSGLNGLFSILIIPMILVPSLITLHSTISLLLSIIIPTFVWNQFLKIKIPARSDRFIRIFLYWIFQAILLLITMLILGLIAFLFVYKEIKSI